MSHPFLIFLILSLALGACVVAPSTPMSTASLSGYDVQHYDLQIQIDPSRGQLKGNTRVLFRATADLQELQLHAAGMEILAVNTPAGPSEKALATGGILTIPLGQTVAAGAESWVDIRYQCQPLVGLHFVNPREKGLDHVPHVFTQGEAERARWWFPCHDIPADRATHTLEATVPMSWTTVAAGVKTSRTLNAEKNTVTVQWEMAQPMPTYLFTFAAGIFVEIEDGWEDVSIRYYVEPEDMAAGVASFAHTPEVLRFFSSYTGFRYPFAKYDQVAVRDFPFGGMENVTATTVTRNAIHAPGLQEEMPSWGLVAHEAAHQWFGDVVTCQDWPHAWLNEGFATYFTHLYRRHAFGEESFQYAMGRAVDSYTRACRGENLRALVKTDYETPFELFFDGTIYPGGAARLHLLRGWFGEEVFKETIQRYLHANAFDSVTTDDLREALESVTGKDHKEMFQQWFYSKGYPELKISWESSGGKLRIILDQVQNTSVGIPEAFTFPLDLRWLERDGWHEGRRWVNAAHHEWEISVSGPPTFLELDPRAFVPGTWQIEEDSNATMTRALQGRSSRSRSLAVKALIGAGNADALSTLWQVAMEDPIPELRRDAIQGLGKFPLVIGQVPRLRASFAREKHVMPGNAWLQLLAQSPQNVGVASLLSGILENENSSPTARVIALRGLSRTFQADALREFLLPWTEVDSPRDGLRGAALRTLAQALPDEQTRSLLLKKSWSGNLTSTRKIALSLLKPWLKTASLENGPNPVHSAVQNALAAGSATLRMTAAKLALTRMDLFAADLKRLWARDPDMRLR